MRQHLTWLFQSEGKEAERQDTYKKLEQTKPHAFLSSSLHFFVSSLATEENDALKRLLSSDYAPILFWVRYAEKMPA